MSICLVRNYRTNSGQAETYILRIRLELEISIIIHTNSGRFKFSSHVRQCAQTRALLRCILLQKYMRMSS